MKFRNGVCRSRARLDGKTALVTGSNSGIGKATVEDFYQRGARVIMACMDMNAANEAIKDIKNKNTNASNLGEITAIHLDLSSLASVRKCAKEILENEQCIHLLINNAGVMACPKILTEDGFEMHFAVNYLGHFLLTVLLLPLISQSTPVRIVNVSSVVHQNYTLRLDDLNFDKRPYSPMGGYRQSKVCNILFTKELARRLGEAGIKGVNVYALHPGIVNTNIVRNLSATVFPGMSCITKSCMPCIAKSGGQGAQTTIHCAVDEIAGQQTGLYYSDCKAVKPSKNARNPEDARKLWDISIKYCQLENYDPLLQH